MVETFRKRGGVDLSNTSVLVYSLQAKYWIIYFIIIQLILGVSNLLFFVTCVVNHNGTETSSGILNFLCVLLLICSLWCQSKTLFSIISVFTAIDAFSECYLLFTRVVVTFEVFTPFISDHIILIFFSIIRVGFSSLFAVVLMRLSWCNGLRDEDDLEKLEVYECIQEMGIYQCTVCSESDENDLKQD